MSAKKNVVATQVFQSQSPGSVMGLQPNLAESGYEMGIAAYRKARGNISMEQFEAERTAFFASLAERFNLPALETVDFTYVTSVTNNPFSGAAFNVVSGFDTLGVYRPAVYGANLHAQPGSQPAVVAEHQFNAARAFVPPNVLADPEEAGQPKLVCGRWTVDGAPVGGAGSYCASLCATVDQDLPLPNGDEPSDLNTPDAVCFVGGYLMGAGAAADGCAPWTVSYMARHGCFTSEPSTGVFGDNNLASYTSYKFDCQATLNEAGCPPRHGSLTIARHQVVRNMLGTDLALPTYFNLLWNAYNAVFPATL